MLAERKARPREDGNKGRKNEPITRSKKNTGGYQINIRWKKNAGREWKKRGCKKASNRGKGRGDPSYRIWGRYYTRHGKGGAKKDRTHGCGVRGGKEANIAKKLRPGVNPKQREGFRAQRQKKGRKKKKRKGRASRSERRHISTKGEGVSSEKNREGGRRERKNPRTY